MSKNNKEKLNAIFLLRIISILGLNKSVNARTSPRHYLWK